MNQDLFVLVADNDAKSLLEGLLPKLIQTEQLESFSYSLVTHPERDNGVRSKAVEFLRSYALNKCRHALVIFDYEGCGQEQVRSSEDIAGKLEEQLCGNGWSVGQAKVVVINPELEIWVWVNENQLAQLIDWRESDTPYSWLRAQDFSFSNNSTKPDQPKVAWERLLRQASKPKSAVNFKKLATAASYRSCQDSAFLKLRATLKEWFGREDGNG